MYPLEAGSGDDGIAKPRVEKRLGVAQLVKAALDNVARSRTPVSGLAAHIKLLAKAPYKYRWLYFTDVMFAGAAMALAIVFRFGFNAVASAGAEYQNMLTAVPLFMAICAFIFPCTGLYLRNWRFVSLGDIRVVLWAVGLSSIVFISVMFAFTRLAMIPRTAIAIQFLLLVPMLTAARMRFRLHELSFSSFSAFRQSNAETLPVLLVGAGKETDSYLRALQGDPQNRYLVVGILDDTSDQKGIRIRNVPVLGAITDFEDIVRQLSLRGKRPRHVIFTAPLSSLSGNSAEWIVAKADEMGIPVSRLSSPMELRDARSADKIQIRSIELTDLLERPQTALDRNSMRKLIKNKRVLITGAGGSIGNELSLQVAALGPSKLILVDCTELNLYTVDMELGEKFPGVERHVCLCNIRDAAKVNRIFEEYKPEFVFHAAALKHVPLVELNPAEGFLTNVIGTRNVADAAHKHSAVAMVQVSTDKVVNPTSVMGLTKRLAELYCQALDLESAHNSRAPRFMTVRFGNVLGSSGSLIPLFQRQIAKGGPLTVTDANMKRFFMTIREAVELTLQASAQGVLKDIGRGEIFVLDMGDQIKIIDIARRMIRLAGFVPDKDIAIKIIGCRPGEKLHEELFDKFEQRLPSSVPGVFGALPSPISLEVLRTAINTLRVAAETGDVDTVITTAKELVPTYQPPQETRTESAQYELAHTGAAPKAIFIQPATMAPESA